MVKGIYITGTESLSGKSLVIFGLSDLLTKRPWKVGYFKAVASGLDDPQPIASISDSSWGITHSEAMDLITNNQRQELLSRILERYHDLAERTDIVICSGSDFHGVSNPLELNFNIEVAHNLGCLLLPVVRGYRRSPREISESIAALVDLTQEQGVPLFGIVVNRVEPNRIDESLTAAKRAVPLNLPIFALQESDFLAKPTIREIAAAINARFLTAKQACDGRDVRDYKVASMELPHLLTHLAPGSLVITGADRSDIIIGTLAAESARNFPRLAGLVLTGGLNPHEKIQALIDDMNLSQLPILAVETDTFETALGVSRVQGLLGTLDQRKSALALALFETGVNSQQLLDRLELIEDKIVTPLMFEADLIRMARLNPRKIVLPEGEESRILRAAELLKLRKVCDFVLLGEAVRIRNKINEIGLQLKEVEIIDPLTSPLRREFAKSYESLRKHKGITSDAAFEIMADPSYFGTMMVHLGLADGMVSGSAHTTQHTIRPALEFIKTKPGVSLVSSVFLMCLSDRVLVFGDCAVNPNPSDQQLAEIAIDSAETALAFGIEPRVAMLSYSTGDSGQGRDVDTVREATRIARTLRPDIKIEGPIQFDAAFDPEVARIKMPQSEVAGRATVFVFPDLNTGNNTYKAVQRSAGAVAIGPVLQGLNKPVNDLSRGCTVADIVNTIAITAIQAQRRSQ